ncbi:unnamed protein product [Miscanthus lutarioriparius]|uniref:Uncharacterized protein n=1 Tax=Miscanthus lutarioriparius TaxID=422564 RepID=A0A811N942_9POAL|nr:unnamed protein product [Miscanthus lutarioriparius]
MVVKKEKKEASASTEWITALALVEPELNAPLRGIIELFDDKSEELIAYVATAGPTEARPSAPWVTTVPNTSSD